MLVASLHSLLKEVRRRGDGSFSGIGVVVTPFPEDLPILPLRPSSVFNEPRAAVDLLSTISSSSHELHDGFHILSPALEVAMVSVYFSPPVVAGINVDPLRRLGGRYMAALFGSTLPNVLATGVASANYGVAVFRQGQEVSAEP